MGCTDVNVPIEHTTISTVAGTCHRMANSSTAQKGGKLAGTVHTCLIKPHIIAVLLEAMLHLSCVLCSHLALFSVAKRLPCKLQRLNGLTTPSRLKAKLPL